MIPSLFVPLSALPLTPNGKIDRKALPDPALSDEAYVAPRTPTEIELAQLWAQLLNVERVGLHSDFFALGGHSLIATQLVSRIEQVFGVELGLGALLRTKNVEEQALLILEAQLAADPALLDELNELSEEELQLALRDANRGK
jgi:acyl carrier protein